LFSTPLGDGALAAVADETGVVGERGACGGGDALAAGKSVGAIVRSSIRVVSAMVRFEIAPNMSMQQTVFVDTL
jgi:hypothetical protein